MPEYADLYYYEPPSEFFEKLDELGNGFYHQPITFRSTNMINLDYYGVEIIKLPSSVESSNSPSSELMSSIRNNFLNFAKGTGVLKSNCRFAPNLLASWEFKEYEDNNINLGLALWNSPNPLNHIFFIEAGAAGYPLMTNRNVRNMVDHFVVNHGAVMVSQFEPCCWIFSTIQTPLSKKQPFSGNRQFGIRLNENGNYEIYARAVDFVKLPTLKETINFIFLTECLVQDYYEISAMTWRNFQKGVKDFIDANGGYSVILEEKVMLPRISNFKNLFRSPYPVNFVNCE